MKANGPASAQSDRKARLKTLVSLCSSSTSWHSARTHSSRRRCAGQVIAAFRPRFPPAASSYCPRACLTDANPRATGLPPGNYKQKRIEEFVLDQLAEQMSLVDLAGFIQMDVYSFARWFKSAFGMPPHQYIVKTRINRAKTLLRTPSVPLVEIALQCGFCNQSHFTSAFRHHVGILPKVYRELI